MPAWPAEGSIQIDGDVILLSLVHILLRKNTRFVLPWISMQKIYP